MIVVHNNNSNVQRFMKSRSSFRQGVLAEKRSNFQRNQFPVTTEAARSLIASARSRAVNPPNKRITSAPSRRNASNGNFLGKFVQKETFTFKKKPKTMDALFANMKEQRMLTMKQQMVGVPRQTVIQRRDRGSGSSSMYVLPSLENFPDEFAWNCNVGYSELLMVLAENCLNN